MARPRFERLLVTGGFGFIGSAFVRSAASIADQVVNLDALTYAGDERRLAGVAGVRSVVADVADEAAVRALLDEVRPDAVVHFAAESHVTRSESDAARFYRSNVEGTRVLLEQLCVTPPAIVIHVSTDEVYGPCEGEPFREEQKEPGEGRATSAYARSKAVADDVARGFTDRLPVIVARLTNCFGPWQHPEKAFPRWVIRALLGQDLPVWGDGGQVRAWLPVQDACEALALLLSTGRAGEVYNIGPDRGEEITNLMLARWIASRVGLPDERVVLTSYDRPQHDRRYAVDATKMLSLGWRPSADVWEPMARAIDWYRENPGWWEPLIGEAESLYPDRAEVSEVPR